MLSCICHLLPPASHTIFQHDRILSPATNCNYHSWTPQILHPPILLLHPRSHHLFPIHYLHQTAKDNQDLIRWEKQLHQGNRLLVLTSTRQQWTYWGHSLYPDRQRHRSGSIPSLYSFVCSDHYYYFQQLYSRYLVGVTSLLIYSTSQSNEISYLFQLSQS